MNNSWWFDYVTVAAVAVGAYIWLILVLRVTGKRSLSKLNAFDFSITVAFGSALAAIIIDEHVGLLRGFLVLAMLAFLQYAVTKMSLWSMFVRNTVRSQPTLLVRDGLIFDEAMKYERVTRDELGEAIRTNGIGKTDKVGAVVLETNGSFSVLPGPSSELDLIHDVRTIGEPSEWKMDERTGRRKDQA